MFHDEIMYSVVRERARDKRAEAEREREARTARRARRFWSEETASVPEYHGSGRGSSAREAAPAAGR